MIRAKKLGRPQLWRRATIDESTTPLWLPVIASEAKQSTAPPRVLEALATRPVFGSSSVDHLVARSIASIRSQ